MLKVKINIFHNYLRKKLAILKFLCYNGIVVKRRGGRVAEGATLEML